MQHFGYLGEVRILPKPGDQNLLARVSMGSQEEASVEESMIFYAILRRRTNREPFSDDPLPESLLAALQDLRQRKNPPGFVSHAITKRSHAIAGLVAEGVRWQWANKAFRRELAQWVHYSNRSAARDGIPGYAQGIDDLMSYTERTAGRAHI